MMSSNTWNLINMYTPTNREHIKTCFTFVNTCVLQLGALLTPLQTILTTGGTSRQKMDTTDVTLGHPPSNHGYPTPARWYNLVHPCIDPTSNHPHHRGDPNPTRRQTMGTLCMTLVQPCSSLFSPLANTTSPWGGTYCQNLDKPTLTLGHTPSDSG